MNKVKNEPYTILEKQQDISTYLYNKYNCCKHILVYSKIDFGDATLPNTTYYCGCIKCGLDNSILEKARESIPFSKKVMYDYLSKNPLQGIETNLACDLELAKAVYFKVKEMHPNTDDMEIITYFKQALIDIRNSKNDDNRKIIIKRLSLVSKLKNWKASDIYTGSPF